MCILNIGEVINSYNFPNNARTTENVNFIYFPPVFCAIITMYLNSTYILN